jgi:hypothetical protein
VRASTLASALADWAAVDSLGQHANGGIERRELVLDDVHHVSVVGSRFCAIAGRPHRWIVDRGTADQEA